MRVLVIEDHAERWPRWSRPACGGRRWRWTSPLDGPSGLERALIAGYDVIVLDRDLLGMHGDEVCARLIAAASRSRVLMLTAAAATEDLVGGLGLGADDYLPKPFDFAVLVARIGALARRAHPAVPPVLRLGDLVVDTARRRASRADKLLELSPKEFDLRTVLAPALASGDPQLAERMIANLADNALRHNAPGGHVEVVTGIRNSRATLSVTNSGPAVPAAAIGRLLQPFQRLGADRTGHRDGLGLGLSIVQAIAQAHDAALILRPRPGGGLHVEVSFPAASYPTSNQAGRDQHPSAEPAGRAT